MITCIREIRRAEGLTLADVAARCVPPTTAQTIGRLETGTRTVSVGWLNRIAAALGVTAADLVRLPDRADLPVAALLGGGGAHAPTHAMAKDAPRPRASTLAVLAEDNVGDYRAGDVIWCERLAPPDFTRATGRDVLVPRRAGRFTFGRLVGVEEGGLLLEPMAVGSRRAMVADVPWIAMATRLVRTL